MLDPATLTCGASIFVVFLLFVWLIELLDKIDEKLRRKGPRHEKKGTSIERKNGGL